MQSLHQALEENELSFLALHRSAVQDLGAGRLFVSTDRSVRTWNFIGGLAGSETCWDEFISKTEALCSEWSITPCLKVTPFSPSAAASVVEQRGWTDDVRLMHMVHGGEKVEPAPDVRIRICSTGAEIREFSRVQSEGFGDPEWLESVHRVNLLNATRRNQIFYLAERDGVAAGVALLLFTGNVAGLYAVATLEEHRGRGVARSLVARAIVDARGAGASTLCLNTASRGAAREAFRRVGFEDVFESRFYAKPEVAR